MPNFPESFRIADLFRTDVTRIGFSFEQIAALSHGEMVKIANRIGHLYLQGSFLSDVAQAVNELFAEKEAGQ